MKLPIALMTLLGSAILLEARPLETYEVPALSSIRRMPDKLPSDILGQDELHFVATRGEFEAGSFVIVPKEDIDKVELKATALKGDAGEIPAENLDIKIVKVWYQDGTAWYSYFLDPSRKELTPELLLNDETLIRVDHETKRNYLRVGDEYQWVNYPHAEAEKYFNHFKEPVSDAKTLQPIALKTGENKQIWVTLRVPDDAKEGIYSGSITLEHAGKKLGEVRVKARVLPFDLPEPKTYYNLDNPFLVSIYRTGVLEGAVEQGLSDEEAMEYQRRIYQNLNDHGIRNVRAEVSLSSWHDRPRNNPERGVELLKNELRLIQETGFVTKPLLTSERLEFSWKDKDDMTPEEFEKGVNRLQTRMELFRDTVQEVLGHADIYATSWDEAGRVNTKRMREQTVHADYPDLKFWVTAKRHHLTLAGYLFDYVNLAGYPARESAAPWHALGAKVASYASPHTGVENPDVYRRWEGLARYKANYDGSFNYKLFDALHPTIYERQKANLWNDDNGGSFRTFNMIFPTKDGVIDTIAWEGFREGIDDIRYATYLKQLVEKAEASGDQKARHLGRKALMWLEFTDMETANLNTVRMEMINYILELKNLLK